MSSKHNGTIIKFKWVKPVGFRIGEPDQFGNFFPEHKVMVEKAPDGSGNRAVSGYDFKKEVVIELDAETVRDLPAHLSSGSEHDDALIRNEYRASQAKQAAVQHEKNNKIRDELAVLEAKGYIKVTYDSFHDAKSEPKAPAKVGAK